jgi:hypothetical protein
MTMPLLSYNNVNINEYPKQIESPTNQQLTIGDLHGNTMKLMYFLIQQGIVTNFTAKDYQKMFTIYEKQAKSLEKEDIKKYDNLVKKLKFNKGTLVRLIGDELADRGQNDYFTLKILEKMDAQDVPMEILFSNHGLEFLRAMEIDSTAIKPRYLASLTNLLKLFGKNLIKKEDIISILKKAYKPKLKAISYSINPTSEQITIFSHAPIGLDNIKELANHFKVNYQDSTSKELAQTIDFINEKWLSL